MMARCGARFPISTLFLALAFFPSPARAQHGKVITIAGTGEDRFFGDGQLATEAGVGGPFGVVIGPDGHLYIAETTNHAIRRVNLDNHRVETIAGTGQPGNSGDGRPATAATVNEPYEICFDEDDNLFFVDMRAHVVRRIDAQTGIIQTIAGTGEPGFSGDGGPAIDAQLNRPHSICLDGNGHLYICDIGNHRIRRVNLREGSIETYAGTGEKAATPDGAQVLGTPLNGPRALFPVEDDLLLALREGNAVYRIDTSRGTVHHIAGTGKKGYEGDGGPAKRAKLAGPKGIAIGPNGDIYLADTESHTIRVIRAETNIIETLVGTGQPGDGPDGNPRKCRLDRPHGVFVDNEGNVYIGDSNNNKMRMYVPAS